MRHLRIAGAKDSIGRHVHVELLLHSRLDVDFGQDAKAFVCKRLPGAGVDLVKVRPGYQPIERIIHGDFSL